MIPADLTLKLWSTGMSAQRIADMLAGSRSTVIRIVSQARSIGDPRAVVHLSTGGKPTGNFRKTKALLARMPKLDVVPLANKPCQRGHAMAPENTYIVAGARRCKACHRARELSYRKSRSIKMTEAGRT